MTLPRDVSEEIRGALKSEEEGWGRMKAVATIRSTEWKTAIWYDTKHQAYLLPLKADVRAKENLKTGQTVSVKIKV